METTSLPGLDAVVAVQVVDRLDADASPLADEALAGLRQRLRALGHLLPFKASLSPDGRTLSVGRGERRHVCGFGTAFEGDCLVALRGGEEFTLLCEVRRLEAQLIGTRRKLARTEWTRVTRTAADDVRAAWRTILQSLGDDWLSGALTAAPIWDVGQGDVLVQPPVGVAHLVTERHALLLTRGATAVLKRQVVCRLAADGLVLQEGLVAPAAPR